MFPTLDEETNARPANGLFWLLRLRWLAALGILLLSGTSVWLFGLRLPWALISGAVLVILASNAAALWVRPVSERAVNRWLVGLIFGDGLLVTVLLYFTGGAHNPFTVLYVLHITLAVILLNGAWAWFLVLLCGAGFGLLFTSDHMLIGPEGVPVCDDLNFHLQGMLAATVAAGGGVVYFVTHLNQGLRRLREENARAREAAARERHFSALITMAAGVSHELATPLGTIAVASRELEVAAQSGCCNAACIGDIRLIRSEVLRCRRLLEKIAAPEPGDGQADSTGMRVDDLRRALGEILPESGAERVEWKQGGFDGMVPRGRMILHALGVLVKNGLEASGPSGKVEVRVERSAGALRWTITDSGSGMAPEVLSRAGEPFFTTKPPGSGMGLGIFLARRMLEKGGATLRMECPSGGGTIATIFQPFPGS